MLGATAPASPASVPGAPSSQSGGGGAFPSLLGLPPSRHAGDISGTGENRRTKVVLIPGFPLIPETQFQSGAQRSGSPHSGPVGGRQPRTSRVLPARSRSVDSRVSSTRFPQNAPVPPGRQLRVLRFLAHSWRETEGALGPGLEAGEQGMMQRCGRRARPAPQARGRAGGRAQGGAGPRAAHGAGDAGPRLSHPAALSRLRSPAHISHWPDRTGTRGRGSPLVQARRGAPGAQSRGEQGAGVRCGRPQRGAPRGPWRDVRGWVGGAGARESGRT